MGLNGDFVVVWESYAYFSPGGNDAEGRAIQGQRYASDGTPRGSEFQINTYTTGWQVLPVVGVDSDGDFVVAWQNLDGSDGNDTESPSIQAQLYASDGTPRGGEFQVNTYTTSSQRAPALGMSPTGDFVVVWDSNGSSGTDNYFASIQAKRYAADGVAIGDEFQVNTYTTKAQELPSVSLDAAGNFVVVWDSNGSSGTDDSAFPIQGQRYFGGIFADGFESGSTTAWSSAAGESP